MPSIFEPPRLSLRVWMVVLNITVAILPFLLLMASGVVRAELRLQTQADLAARAPLVVRALEVELQRGHSLAQAADKVFELTQSSVGQPHPIRVIVVDAQGAVQGDTAEGSIPTSADVPAALAGTVHVSAPGSLWEQPGLRWFLERQRVVISTPVRQAGSVVGAVIVARKTRRARAMVFDHGPSLAFIGLAAALFTALASIATAQRVSRSLQAVTETTKRIAAGDVDAAASLDERPSAIRDVNELARGVSAMATRIEERAAFNEQFARHAAHEFRTPLSTLIGTVELLKDEPDMPVEQRAHFVEEAARQLHRLNATIDGLLALSRADHGGHREEVPLDGIGREVCVDVDYREGGGTVWADPVLLRRALTNLVDNARQHGAEPITVRARADGWDVVDAGGIEPSVLPQVFERFYTTDRTAGVGLGLAFTAAVAAAHGGSVTVDSEPGRTVFVFTVQPG